jgi:peptidoglycan/LPS O-acetylase OafA/YrhL
MWILSLGTLTAVLFGLYPLEDYTDPSLKLAHALFFALHRNSWGLAISWIIFSCEMGDGGIVRKFLELPLWRPLGRMSLSFYLIHSLYITIHIASGRVPLWFNDAKMVNNFFICITFF